MALVPLTPHQNPRPRSEQAFPFRRMMIVQGKTIELGFSLRRVTDCLGRPIDYFRGEGPYWFSILYYFDGDYYSFYFSRRTVPAGQRTNPYDDSMLVDIDVNGGY
jgi:hypothetical protein